MATSQYRAQVRDQDPITEIGTALSSRFLVFDPITSIDHVNYYRAREYQEKREVVIKVPIGDAAEKQLFRLQASAAARLTHKNILKQSGPEELGDVLFSVIPVQPVRETLSSLLDRAGWLEVDDAIDIACQIAEALDYAHASGVLHLALHPGHILINNDGTVLVSEFGIDQNPELDREHSLRARRCPAQYQSPEQMDNTFIDCRSDLYSLGVIIFEMLTDRLPFDSVDANHIRARRERQTPMVPHVLFPELPRMLSEIVLHLLESSPEKRFRYASDVLSALQQLRQLPSNEMPEVDYSSEIASNTEEAFADTDSALSPAEPGSPVPDPEMQSATPPKAQVTAAEKLNHFVPYNGWRPTTNTTAVQNSSSINPRVDTRSPNGAKDASHGKLRATSWLLIAALIVAFAIAVIVVMNLAVVRGT